MTKHRVVCDIPTSVNAAYRNVPRVGRVKTKKYKLFAAKLVALLPEADKERYLGKGYRWRLNMLLGIGDNRDVSNCIKTAEDVLATFYGLEDALNDAIHAERIRPHLAAFREYKGRCVVIMEVYDEGTDAGEVVGAAAAALPAEHDRQGGGGGAAADSGDDPAADYVGAGEPPGPAARQAPGRRRRKAGGTGCGDGGEPALG